MSNAIEIEAKVLLPKEDYQKIVKLFPNSPRYVQTNYYIDNDAHGLAKAGIALRIREKAGQMELTLKTPLSQGLLEKSTPISMNDFASFRDFNEFPEGDLKRFLTMLDFDVKELKILTSLSTERIDVAYEGGLLSIDRNTYNGQVDYEVEFEFNNLEGAKRILGQFLEDHGVKAEFSEMSKTRRAMSTIK